MDAVRDYRLDGVYDGLFDAADVGHYRAPLEERRGRFYGIGYLQDRDGDDDEVGPFNAPCDVVREGVYYAEAFGGFEIGKPAPHAYERRGEPLLPHGERERAADKAHAYYRGFIEVWRGHGLRPCLLPGYSTTSKVSFRRTRRPSL